MAANDQKLRRLTERVWLYDFEEERDRPSLGYIHGDQINIAVDAGHSAAHIFEFYRALTDAGLPLPGLTVLTHWHWDHTFGMHAAHGVTLACEKTDRRLRSFIKKLGREGPGFFLDLDPSIQKEYANGQPVTVVPANVTFRDEIFIDAGGCPVRVFQSVSPHTDDAVLVHAVNEKVLFLGDAACGVFPAWEKNITLCRGLARVISQNSAEVFVSSHWEPQSKESAIRDLLSDAREDAPLPDESEP